MQKYVFTDSGSSLFTITRNFAKIAVWQTLLRKNAIVVEELLHKFFDSLVFRIYIRKTYIDGSPKPQNVQIWKMHAFSVKCVHFQLNARIFT